MIQKIKNKKYRLETKLYKALGYSKKRSSSYPYISGDTFRTLTENRYEETNKSLDYKLIKKHPLIFVESHLLIDFFENVHPKIEHKYVLISHNGDENITDKYIKFVDEKLHHWFAQNCDLKHEKITPVPIGLENMHYFNHGRLDNFDKLRDQKVEKINKLLYGFSVGTNPIERSKALEVLNSLEYSKKISKRLNSYDYLKYMQKYIAVVSPPGNGLDCHRTWEALYLGVVPVVKDTVFNDFFKSIEIPLFVIKSWSILESENVIEKIKIFDSQKDFDPLWFEYWKNIIQYRLETLKTGSTNV